jgi:hypothetical protein
LPRNGAMNAARLSAANTPLRAGSHGEPDPLCGPSGSS